MKLFDDSTHNNATPAKYTEPTFHFLNRSAKPEFARVRSVLDDWFARYPASEKAHLATRFRSPRNSQHQAAFFELFLHELLLRLECRVAIHPPAPSDKSTSPDFLITPPTGSPFYLEAVVTSCESKEDSAAQARANVVYDALDSMDSPNFFIGMEIEGAPQTPPPARHIKRFLKERLDGLDPDDVEELYESDSRDPRLLWRYEHDGWVIDFFPTPKSPRIRGKAGVRPIGMQLYGGWSKTSSFIREVILRKAGRYGALDLPFVIAMNVLAADADRDDMLDALFGHEEVVVRTVNSRPVASAVRRAPDGVWTSRGGPSYTRLSAVLVCAPALPWNLSRVPICLYNNPWAERLYESVLTRLPQAVVKNNRIEWLNGESLTTVFDLDPSWPASQ